MRIGVLALDHVEPANAAADMNADSRRVLFRHLKRAHLHGFIAAASAR